jgi:hypothetical protein
MQMIQPLLARSHSYSWFLILGFVLVTVGGIVAGAGGVLRLGYPLGALGVGLFLFQRSPILYVGFAWWLTFLTPLVRRLIDLNSGWVEPSPLLLAPFLVMLVSGMTFVKGLPGAVRQLGLPFVLAAIGVGYGLLVGVVKNSPTAVVVPFLNWFAPLLFGFYFYANWRSYPQYRQMLQRVFLWGVLVMGAYGIWQYLTAPEWDRFWIVSTGLLTFGTPEPLGIRVFSTMNSPGPFATVMMAGLLLLFTSQHPLKFAAAGVGYLAFLLSLVRSAWLSWVVAVLAFLPSLKPRLQMRLLVTVLVMAILVLPLVNMEPFAGVINARVNSFFNVEGDVSYNERLDGYAQVIMDALMEIPGNGLGFVLESGPLGSNDSGILTLLFTLGWFGSIPYLGGVLLLLFGLFKEQRLTADPFFTASRAICVGVFAQIGLGNPTLAQSGMVFWTFAGMAIAAQQYYAAQRQVQPEPNDSIYSTVNDHVV